MGFGRILGIHLALLCVVHTVTANLTSSVDSISLHLDTCETIQFTLSSTDEVPENATVTFHSVHADVARANISVIHLQPGNETKVINATVCGYDLGHSVIYATLKPAFTGFASAFVHVAVYRVEFFDLISFICGWTYFFAWSISFYPQIVINYKRQSVVGLNFDFLVLNLIGYILYSVFNCGLYWVPSVQREYFSRYPRGLNPVQLNDVGFSVHAFLITSVTISQCFIYDRGDQTVSKITMVIVAIYAAILSVSGILVMTQYILMLDLLYTCSYIKLSTTLIKYIPQALMNYRRKSTVGWSIGNVICDFLGGILSIVQMMIISYNYDDWASIFGDITKFGLGLFSVAFDILFLLQHYVFYRETTYVEIEGDDANRSSTSDINADAENYQNQLV